jgi:hypothetical protein
MISICVLPNFKGSKSDWIKVTISCLLLDSTYMIPMLNQILK